jgi:hypothetical protein
MALTDVNLFRIDGSTGSIGTASIDNIKNSAAPGNNIILNSDGTTTLTPNNIIKSGTAVASTSGTFVDFTGIPSWVKRVTVMFDGVSTNGSSPVIVQCGAGSATTSGYIAYVYAAQGSTGGSTLSFTTGFAMDPDSGAVFLRYGHIVLTNITGNNWVAGVVGGCSNTTNFRAISGGGSIGISGTLDRIRITTVNGTDTFDAGTVNILFEG